VSGEAVAPQYFNFPQLLPEDVRDAVRIEVEAGLPFSVEDALVDYILFPEQRPAPGKVRTHGVAIAADGSLVENRLAAIRRANVQPFSVETDAAACANAYIATVDAVDADGAVAVLNIGHRYSNLALIGGATTLLMRDLPWAGKHLTEAIAEHLDIRLDEAQGMKHAHWEGDAGTAGDLDGVLPEVLEKSGAELVERLRDTIQYWVGERLVPGMTKLLVTGGGSQVRLLPEFLGNALGVAAESWSPIAGDTPDNEPMGYRLTVAFGLALRKFARAVR
jgi:type IV pilus assembly protein PilM